MSYELDKAKREYDYIAERCGADIGHKIMVELNKKSKDKPHVFSFDLASVDTCTPIAVNYKYDMLPSNPRRLTKIETTAEDYVAWTAFGCTAVKVRIDPVHPTVKFSIEKEFKL